MRSLNWTDHANFTKQQQIELAEIDIKLLRWVSEIVADGSEIRSLAGRSARLGDGTSRNPKDREELMNQRTKDLEGLIGQVRGFSLDEFLSDWEPAGDALPWAVGDTGWVSDKPQQSEPGLISPAACAEPIQVRHRLSQMMAGAGVAQKLKVLYVPDYIPREQRLLLTSRLHTELSRLLPSYEVQLALAEGPFEDDDGVGAHFEKEALGAQPVSKQIGSLKRLTCICGETG